MSTARISTNLDDLIRQALSVALITLPARRQQLFALLPQDTFKGLSLYYNLSRYFAIETVEEDFEAIAVAAGVDVSALVDLTDVVTNLRPLQEPLIRLLSARQTAAQTAGLDITQWAEAITKITKAAQEPTKQARAINISDWCCGTRYQGPVPETLWLVKKIFQLGVALMVAAMGDTGKSFSLLRLAYLIATGNDQSRSRYSAFGGTVEAYGTAVIFTAEDCQNTIHARIKAIDENDRLKDFPGKLLVIPLPDAGGPISLVSKSRDTLIPTPAYEMIKEQLLAIPDLKMVVFDPLQNFTTLDLNAPENSQYICGVMAELATVTGAAVFVSHHMKKTDKQITTIAEAREAIRGTTALVDSLRGAYALWPESETETRKVCTALGYEYKYGSIVRGAVVKANGDADRNIKTNHRDGNGILQDVTDRLTTNRIIDSTVLVDAIVAAALDNHPFTKSGKSGVYDRRDELPEPFKSMSRNKLIGYTETLITDGLIVRAAAGTEKITNWLDRPGGKFAIGDGKFAPGSRSDDKIGQVDG
jgi:RecA-family ATPase